MISKDEVNKIIITAREDYGEGIYIDTEKYKELTHPCGWDFIELWGDADDKIELADISNGIYDEHPFAGKTLSEVFELVGIEDIKSKKWGFEQHHLDSWG